MEYGEEPVNIDPLGVKNRKRKLLRIITKQQIIFRKLKSKVPPIIPIPALTKPRNSGPQEDNPEDTPTRRSSPGKNPLDNEPKEEYPESPNEENDDDIIPEVPNSPAADTAGAPNPSDTSPPKPENSAVTPSPLEKNMSNPISNRSNSQPNEERRPPVVTQPQENVDHFCNCCGDLNLTKIIAYIIVLMLLLWYLTAFTELGTLLANFFTSNPSNMGGSCSGKKYWII